MQLSRQHRGFTIVELLVVIVVIAILAAISIVSFTGIQSRARDAQRVSDVNNIVKALEMYRLDHGEFPDANPNPGYYTCWEGSSDPGFLSVLDEYTGGKRFAPPGVSVNNVNDYAYPDFTAGSYGCDAADGPYAVLWVRGMEAQSGPVAKKGPCTGDTQGVEHDDEYAVWLF